MPPLAKLLVLTIQLFYSSQAAWDIHIDGTKPTGVRTSCWLSTILKDWNDGWRPSRCDGLQQITHGVFLEADDCAAYCKSDTDCSVWQFTDKNECWWGKGASCDVQPLDEQKAPGIHLPHVELPKFLGGNGNMNGAVIAGQRIMHGAVAVIENLKDTEISGLGHIGIFPDGRDDSIERCKITCYSETTCRYWTYGSDGCWMERPPKHTFEGGISQDNDWARTMSAGEMIQHECPDQTDFKQVEQSHGATAAQGAEVAYLSTGKVTLPSNAVLDTGEVKGLLNKTSNHTINKVTKMNVEAVSEGHHESQDQVYSNLSPMPTDVQHDVQDEHPLKVETADQSPKLAISKAQVISSLATKLKMHPNVVMGLSTLGVCSLIVAVGLVLCRVRNRSIHHAQLVEFEEMHSMSSEAMAEAFE